MLVVGGGEVALRKVSLLQPTGALITLVAPRINPELGERAAAGTLTIVAREFIPGDLDDMRLVIVATSRRAVNRWIAKLCDARAIPVNVVDDRGGIPLHRAGHRRSRSGAGRGFNRRHLARIGAPLARAHRGGHSDGLRRIGGVVARAARGQPSAVARHGRAAALFRGLHRRRRRAPFHRGRSARRAAHRPATACRAPAAHSAPRAK